MKSATKSDTDQIHMTAGASPFDLSEMTIEKVMRELMAGSTSDPAILKAPVHFCAICQGFVDV